MDVLATIRACGDGHLLRRAIEASQSADWRGASVYLASTFKQYGWWKIGYTTDVKQRIPQLRQYGVAAIDTIIPCEHARVVEFAFHTLFHSVVTPYHRECFYLSPDDVAWMRTLQPLHGNRIAYHIIGAQAGVWKPGDAPLPSGR